MYTLDKIKSIIVTAINQSINDTAVKAEDLVAPPNPEMGDISLPCFSMAKKSGRNPGELANELVAKVNFGEYISSARTAGPYMNFAINKKKLIQDAFRELFQMREEYGRNQSGQKQRVMIEFSNGNTHKELHIGHIRNIAYGDAVSRILNANGYEVIPVSYINDFGIHVAKTLWCYLEYFQGQEVPENKGYFLGQVYARSTQELKDNQVGKKMVELLMKKIESKAGEEYDLWQKTRIWTIEQFDKVYQEMDIKFDKIFYESEYIDQGRALVEKLEEKGILIQSEGALIADLNAFNLGVLVVLRSDGTALYPVADLPLAVAKIEKFNLDRSVYVVDIRQSQYFKQIFKILELIGYKKEMIHLGYDVVKLPSGMMSSRTGNIISYEDLRSDMIKKTQEETGKRHPDWDAVRVAEVAEKIAFGAMKFEMIKVSREAVITFDINQALRFEGYTSAYLQYTVARINSIIRKSEDEYPEVGDLELNNASENLKESQEYELSLLIAHYPQIVEFAGIDYNPSEIAKFIFELAQAFNDYYHTTQVLVDDANTRSARILLARAVRRVLTNGLALLGISTMDEM